MTDAIDRCWDLIETGELAAAQRLVEAMPAAGSAEAALEITDLRAAIAMESGLPDDARGIWETHCARFPEDLEGRLELARVVGITGDPSAALAVASDALALARQVESAEAELAALLIVAWAEQEGDGEARTEVLDRLATLVAVVEPEDSDFCYDLGAVFREADRNVLALACFTRAIAGDPEHADAHYERGLVLRDQGDETGAREAFLTTLRLDASAPRPEWRLETAEVEALAEEALGALPRDVVDRLRNVPILVEDFPSEESVRDGADPRLFGLFAGIPYPDSSSAVPTSPDHIILYLGSLERAGADPNELAEQLRITIWHETGHYFGLEEEDLDALGLG